MNPASLNLQNVRKRAKLLLRQHASRHFPVAERIRRACPAFAERSDREVLDAPFSLAQAQQVVARELRFEDWTQLKRSIENMSNPETNPKAPPSTDRPEFLRTHPQIFVTDIERAASFYRDLLGFSVE